MNSQTITSRVAAVLFAALIVTSGFLAFVPTSAQAATGDVVSEIGVSVDSVSDTYTTENHMYVLSRSDNTYDTLTIIDISDPNNPTVTGSLYTSNFAREIAVAGNYAYIAANGQTEIIDISDKTNPTLVTSFGPRADSVAVSGDTLFVGETKLNSDYKLVAYDISDPTAPVETGSVLANVAENLQVSENHPGYLFGFANGELTVWDITTPSSMTVADTIAFGSVGSTNNALDISGDYAYVAETDSGLSKVDISDPTNINVVDTLSFTSIDSVYVDGGSAAVSDSTADTINMVDVTSMTTSESINTPILPNSHTVLRGGYLYNIDDSRNFEVLSAEDYKNSNTLSGVVQDETGAPVANATVEIYGVDHSKITAATGQSLEERAEELLSEAKDPYPAEWNENLNLVNLFENTEDDYVAVHSDNVLPTNRFFDGKAGGKSADLDTPQLVVAADTPLVMTIWDTTASDRTDLLDNAVDEDLPGRTTDGTVVVTKLSMSGEVLDTKEIETKDIYKTGSFPVDKMHEGVRLSLGQGFYEVSAKGSSTSYVIASLGDLSVEEMGNLYATNLEDSANRLTDRANEIDSKLGSGEFGRIVVETDANGQFTAEISSAFSTVDVTAYKGGDLLEGVTLTDRSVSELQKQIEAKDYDGSIYIPTQTQTVSTPFPSSVTVEVREVTSLPNTGDIDTSKAEDLLNKTLNETQAAGELITDPDAWDNATQTAQEELYNSLLISVIGNNDVEMCIIDKAEEAGVTSDYGYSSVSSDTARIHIGIMQACLGLTSPVDTPINDDIEETIDETVDDATDTVQQLLNLRIPFSGSLNPDTASVIVRYADGSFETLDEEYWMVDKGIVGNDAVVIEDYPLPVDQPMVSFEVIASDDDGVDRGSVPVRNPAYAGETPALKSIKLNTLTPGAGQSVQIDVTPTDDSSFKSVKAVKVWDANGNELSSSLSNGQLSFNAASEGAHLVKLTVEDANGNEYVERLRVGANDDDLPFDPSLKVQQGFLGTYAIVGDGAIDGEIKQRNGVTSVGVVLAQGENPSAVRVHLNELDDTKNIKVRLMQGANEASYDRFTTVFVYTSQMSEDSLVYRGSNEPISDEKGPYGVRLDKADSELIVTYTETDGTVDLSVNNNPSFVDRTLFWVRDNLSGISASGFLGGVILPIGIGLSARRRAGDAR